MRHRTPARADLGLGHRLGFGSGPVLEHLKKFGQLLDSEIAAGTGIPLPKVRSALSELVEHGEIARCKVTRFTDGKAVEAMVCRISGYIPPAAPGPKKK